MQAGGLSYWWVADGSGLSWNPETVAAHRTQAVYASPGIAITSTSVVITAINTKPGNVMYWSQPFGTTPWNKELSPPANRDPGARRQAYPARENHGPFT